MALSKNKTIMCLFAGILFLILALGIKTSDANGFTGYGGPSGVPVVASSTTFTVTTGASLRILATSTNRVAASVETYNCAANSSLFMRFNDVTATAATGKALHSTSTTEFGGDVPMQRGSVQAIAGTGTCTVLVTEWRTAN